jgi:hypothetical protein
MASPWPRIFTGLSSLKRSPLLVFKLAGLNNSGPSKHILCPPAVWTSEWVFRLALRCSNRLSGFNYWLLKAGLYWTFKSTPVFSCKCYPSPSHQYFSNVNICGTLLCFLRQLFCCRLARTMKLQNRGLKFGS